MSLIERYQKFLNKYKIYVIIFWVIMLGFGIWLGPKFLDETSTTFDPPEDSPSAIAEEVMIQEFPTIANQTSIIVLLRTTNSSEDVVNSKTHDIHDDIVTIIESFEKSEIILSILSYYILVDYGYPEIASDLVSSGNRSMLINIELDYEEHKSDVGLFIDYVREELSEIQYDEEEISVYLTGFIVMYIEMREATEEDMTRMDLIVIPLALLVLAIFLRSIKLMIIPILSMSLSILISFLVMYPIAKTWDIFSFVPSIMMSLVIALSIDYSLFLLTRYREEIINQKPNSEAVLLMNKNAGHTVSVSGITLAITYLGLAFFPLQLLSTVGIGAAISIIFTLLVNLTLTPALLLTFNKFFSKFSLYKKLEKRKKTPDIDKKKWEIEKQFKSIWFKIGKLSTKFAPFVILVILAAAIPISIQVFKFDRSIDLMQILPRGSDSRNAYEALAEDFSPGQVLPFYLVIKSNEVNGILNDDFYETSILLLETLINKTEADTDSFTSVMIAGGYWIGYDLARTFLNSSYPNYHTPFGESYRIVFDRFSNFDNSTILVDISTPFDPWGDKAENWVKETRIVLEDFQSEDYEIHLAQGSATMIDAIDNVYELFPIMMIITLIVVYIIIAIMFKSVFIPLRLIITVGITLSWIYGLTIVVFKSTFFGNLIPVLGDVNSLYWITPIMAFSILIGLALDYDIFLLSRISEFRDKGFTDKASIHKGLYKTGNVISFAGIIMAIAFSGLLLAREMVLIQFGFMLCVAVLIDTFIIRTILVPAIMAIAEKWNWWPGKKPDPTKDENDIE
ncbi:MAG: MMPL family transporter [Candidatus Heimdallarchaeota archaeon]|nr:MMPL family transporter [Candidatus Heimdallarchaeota archaeon]MCK4878676.1 MMPL family transporter [Candidatus Heimdallarchaeota archaeon]